MARTLDESSSQPSTMLKGTDALVHEASHKVTPEDGDMDQSIDSISKLTISNTAEDQQPDTATPDSTQNVQESVQETTNNSTSEEPSEKITLEEHMAYMQIMESRENEDEDTTKTIGEQCQCKLFIGGLSWDTNEQALRDHFEQFGEVTDVMVVYNRTAGVSRGFGFVTFKDRGVAQKVILQHHRINDKSVEAKLAVQKGEQVRESFEQKMARQIFVGGLPPNTTSDELKEWAQALFGREKVTNAIAVLDLETKTTRGFGFVNFQTPQMVDIAVQPGMVYELGDKRVEVKRAQAQLQHHRGRGGVHPASRGKGGHSGKGAYSGKGGHRGLNGPGESRRQGKGRVSRGGKGRHRHGGKGGHRGNMQGMHMQQYGNMNMGHMGDMGNMQDMPLGGGYTIDGEIPSAVSAQVYYQQNLQMAQMSLPLQQQGYSPQAMPMQPMQGHPQQPMQPQQGVPLQPQQRQPQQMQPQQGVPMQPQQMLPQQGVPLQPQQGVPMQPQQMQPQQGVPMQPQQMQPQQMQPQQMQPQQGVPTQGAPQQVGKPLPTMQNGVMGTMHPGMGFMPTLHSQGNVMRYD